MNLVDKYIFKQLSTNSLLILILITSVFCLGKSVQLIELMVSRGLPATVFFKLIFNSLPQIIPTLLPIITGLSIFLFYSRMQTGQGNGYSSVAGFSNVDLVKPVLVYGIILTLLSFFLQYIKRLYLIKTSRFFYTLSKMIIPLLFAGRNV